MSLQPRAFGWKCKKCPNGFMDIQPYYLKPSQSITNIFKCNSCDNTESVDKSLDEEGYEWKKHPGDDESSEK